MVGISKYGYEMRKEAEATKPEITGKKILDKLLTPPKCTVPPMVLHPSLTPSNANYLNPIQPALHPLLDAKTIINDFHPLITAYECPAPNFDLSISLIKVCRLASRS